MLKHSIKSSNRDNSAFIKKDVCDYLNISTAGAVEERKLKQTAVHTRNKKKKKKKINLRTLKDNTLIICIFIFL